MTKRSTRSLTDGLDDDANGVAYDAVIVGAGFAGLYMLHRLRQRGLRVLLLEAGSGVGGTWFWNRYPGARCDVESVDYSYSFSEELQQEWDWSERFATQPELLRYVNHVADRFDLRDDIRLDTRVSAAHFDEDTDTWAIRTDDGVTVTARLCIMATGNLSVPRKPDIEGLDRFEGEVLHTGDWPHHEVSLAGKRVGVIGTGSSGTQLIPVAAREADELYVFQRTPNFSVPANNAPLTPEGLAAIKANYAERRAVTRASATGLYRSHSRVSALEVDEQTREQIYEENWATAGFGFLQAFSDLLLDQEANATAVDFLHGKTRALVEDPEVAASLIATDYPFGSKRPCVDSNFFQTFNRDNVTLVDVRTHPITTFGPDNISTDDATYALDTIVFATGFDAMTGALGRIEIRGRGGELLADHWREGPSTYLGLAVAGFPNLFTITGPGSPSILTNVIVSIEQHVEFLDEMVASMLENGHTVVEALESSESEWTQLVNDMAYETLYPFASSWYMGPKVPDKRQSFMPYVGGLRAYRRKCADVAAAGYDGFALK